MQPRGRDPADFGVLTAFGVVSAVVMVVAYGLEDRDPIWVAVFAAGCLSTAVYGVITHAWVFAVLEAIWSVLAVHRFSRQRAS